MTGPGHPRGIDVSKPNIARVYDALLGGKDRQSSSPVTETVPAELDEAGLDQVDGFLIPPLVREIKCAPAHGLEP
jgi:S-adenosyl methyltransferase